MVLPEGPDGPEVVGEAVVGSVGPAVVGSVEFDPPPWRSPMT